MLKVIIRNLKMTAGEEAFLLHSVMREGLSSWISHLADAGIRIHELLTEDGSILDIAIA